MSNSTQAIRWQWSAAERSHELAPLPYPVVFVVRNVAAWPELFDDSPHLPDVDDNYRRFIGVESNWVVQSYIQLRQRGLDVRIASDYVPGEICIAAYQSLRISHFPFRSYVVACRADNAQPEICEQTIVQNPLKTRSTDHFIPHWPQPGLRPRDSRRGACITSATFKGSWLNLWEPFRSPEFRHRLGELGIAYRICAVASFDQSPEWNDYRNDDLVLAVRDLTEQDFLLKPPSKLVNAWMAGVPALLGPEQAYQQLRRSELDYLEIRTVDEALDAVRRFRARPQLYRAMIDNGHRRAEEYTTARIAQRWRDLLAGDVAEGYRCWASRSSLHSLIVRPCQFALRVCRHLGERRRYFSGRDHGFRPVSGRWT